MIESLLISRCIANSDIYYLFTEFHPLLLVMQSQRLPFFCTLSCALRVRKRKKREELKCLFMYHIVSVIPLIISFLLYDVVCMLGQQRTKRCIHFTLSSPLAHLPVFRLINILFTRIASFRMITYASI